MKYAHAIVETDLIGENVLIGEFSVIRPNVRIGNNVIIHPHVVIESGVTVGDHTEIFPGTYIGKAPKGVGATARPINFVPKVDIGAYCAIGPNAVIFYDTEIGHNTLIGDGASLREQVRVGNYCMICRYVTINYNTKIGNNTRILDLTHITGNCNIGNDVFVSVLVSTVNDNVVVKREYEKERIIGPCIHDNATIGAGACLLPGVVIGEGAFVGVHAVVTKNVAPYNVVIGTPARPIKNLKNS